ncbi:hypothetical protein CH373_10270 [Leptospira perolatii]|uniref:Uncharacterized protein n=1 Tax=Leptospira perolatii TaxID=2023191 RepID=A0A2M9ZMM5_9LEPT|nr:hypothetical protein [Leptospira perolatii]PJZ70153.1 hypothetical protein CH360_08015 [Leptospira perolatii]PJZ73342.1 hypothetical protein CH373_10270 [Leptospira perolatii]
MNSKAENHSSIFEPYGHSDLYSLDNLYFSPARNHEIWDLSRVREFSPAVLAFLYARAELLEESLEIRKISNLFKKGLSCVSGKDSPRFIQVSGFVPKLIGQKVPLHFFLEPEQESKESSELFLNKDETFHFNLGEGKGFQLFGSWKGREYLFQFRKSQCNLTSLLGDFSTFAKERKISGNLFLRTNRQSYLHFIKPGAGLSSVFVQEKNSNLPEFLFIALEYSRVSE